MKIIRPLTKTSTPSAPRSEQVRERRKENSQARVRAAVHHASNPVVRRSLPVTPGFTAQPLIKRTQSKARRKFSIALHSEGAQIVLPALPMVRPGWQTLSALLVVAMLAAVIYLTSSDTFRVEALTVNGAQRLQPADLMAVLDLGGESVFSLDAAKMTGKLREAFPELSSVQVSVGLPNEVILDVVERTPVFEWKYGDTTLWIDMDGAAFFPRGTATLAVTVVADVPPPMVLLDDAPVNTEAAEQVGSEAAASVIGQYQTFGNVLVGYDPTKQRVDKDVLMAAASLTLRKPAESDLVYDKENGFGWRDPRGWDVYFGQALDDLDQKLEMYQAIINQLAQQGITPTMISVSHLYAPFYRAPQGVSSEP